MGTEPLLLLDPDHAMALPLRGTLADAVVPELPAELDRRLRDWLLEWQTQNPSKPEWPGLTRWLCEGRQLQERLQVLLGERCTVQYPLGDANGV